MENSTRGARIINANEIRIEIVVLLRIDIFFLPFAFFSSQKVRRNLIKIGENTDREIFKITLQLSEKLTTNFLRCPNILGTNGITSGKMYMRNDGWIKKSGNWNWIRYAAMLDYSNVRIDFTFPALCRYSSAREHIAVVWHKRGAGSSVKTEK